MSQDSRPQNRHPVSSPKPKGRGSNIAFGKEFEQVIGDTIRKTVSEYHGLLRQSLNKELGQMVGNYEKATSGIAKPVSLGVKDQLIERIRQEVRQVFDNAIFSKGSQEASPGWLKGANRQWKTDEASPQKQAQQGVPESSAKQPEEQATPDHHQAHPSSLSGASSEYRQPTPSQYHQYEISSIPAYEQKPVQPEPEPTQRVEFDDLEQSDVPHDKTHPQHHQYQIGGIPAYEPKQSVQQADKEERVQQETVYVEDRTPENVRRDTPVDVDNDSVKKVKEEQSSEVTPPSASFWVLPHGEYVEESEEVEEVAVEQSYLEQFMLPRPSGERESEPDYLPVRTDDHETLSATTGSFLGIEEAGGNDDIPFFVSEAEMAEEDIPIYIPEEDMDDDDLPFFISEAEMAEEDSNQENVTDIVPAEPAETETALAAILEAVRDLKVVIHDSNQVVHIADQVEEETSKIEIYTAEETLEDADQPQEQLAISSATTEDVEDSASEEDDPAELVSASENLDALEESQEDDISEPDEIEESEGASEASVETVDQHDEEPSKESVVAVVEDEEPAEPVESIKAETVDPQEEDAISEEDLPQPTLVDESSDETVDQESEAEEISSTNENVEAPTDDIEESDEILTEEDDLIETMDEDEELTEETVKKVVFEGTVRLNVEANGCIKEIVHFVRELRQKPQLRLLRLVGNNREGVDIWLGLREPLRIKSILPELDGVSIITKPLPHIGSPDERLLSVRLSRISNIDDSKDLTSESELEQEVEPVGAANS